MKTLAQTLKALSDETRLSIVALLLLRGELCVCDVMGALDVTQSKTSRHLRYLFNAGLVTDQRIGQWVHYRLSEDMSESQRAVLDAVVAGMSEADKDELIGRLEEWFLRKGAAVPGCEDQCGCVQPTAVGGRA